MSKNKSNNSFAKSKTFKFSLVASAIMGISSPVFAEEAKAEESDTEIIVVTGIRGALITAAQTKRDSSETKRHLTGNKKNSEQIHKTIPGGITICIHKCSCLDCLVQTIRNQTRL